MADELPEPDVRLEMFSQPRFLAAARALVGSIAQRLGFTEIQCGQISLAVDEALCNVITHGYDRRPDGRLWVNLWPLEASPPGIKVVIEDRAHQVDPDTIQPRDLDDIRPGGLGVHIIREVMDEVTYERRSGPGMRLTMIKHLRPVEDNRAPAAPAPANSESNHEQG
ncbi:MAG: ATP-binding protein [Planctomycetota bacterium]|jgi:anti-sigma regulatory factor (Ser/Thr protein kinase)